MKPAARPFRIDLGYDGTDFFGSQRQPGVRTVQGVLEDAGTRLTGEPVTIAMAGRTDRGVHAVGQVASCRLVWRGSERELTRALDALTPDDVVIYRVRGAPDEFHARYSARFREYRYRVWECPVAPVLLRRVVWWVRSPLDVRAMGIAAGEITGRRDFASLAGSGAGVPGSGISTERTVFAAEWREVPQAFEGPQSRGRLLEFRIRADGFLPHMVRNLVGCLVQIGRGERPPEWLGLLLAARDRRLAGAPAPPHGLALWRVGYDEDTGVDVDTDAEGIMGVEGDENILTEGI